MHNLQQKSMHHMKLINEVNLVPISIISLATVDSRVDLWNVGLMREVEFGCLVS